jgi:hypothetical protein
MHGWWGSRRVFLVKCPAFLLSSRSLLQGTSEVPTMQPGE